MPIFHIVTDIVSSALIIKSPTHGAEAGLAISLHIHHLISSTKLIINFNGSNTSPSAATCTRKRNKSKDCIEIRTGITFMRPVCVNVHMSTCACSACGGGACLASMCVCMHVSTQHRMTHNTRKLLILLAKLIDPIQCQLWRYRYVHTHPFL